MTMALRHECANCGRDVRGLPDNERRFEGGRWYCSQSCFLTAESAASRGGGRKRSKPRHKWRRRIGWTLGSIVALFVVLIVVGAVVGTPKKKSARAGRRGTTVVAKSSGRGSAAHPIPKGALAAVGGNWWMRVISVEPNATEQVKAVSGQYGRSTPPHAQDFMVAIGMKYKGGG